MKIEKQGERLTVSDRTIIPFSIEGAERLVRVARVGGIGIAPGANSNYESGYAVFEASGGTAPEHLREKTLITAAMEKAFPDGEVTNDRARFMSNGKSLGTKQFGEKLVSS